MNILLTGSNGMVGKNILEAGGIEKHKLLTPNSKELNLLDLKAIENYIKKNKPDFIIHAAGKVGGIQANISNPVEFLTANLDMGKNIVLAAMKYNVPNLMNLASSCMYPKDAENPLNEDLILKGQLEPTNEGYALAKIVTTRLCSYISANNSILNYKTIIPCNLYGKYDKFDPKHSHMLPAVIRKIHEAKVYNADDVDIWGDGKARREFMYAGDLADFVIFAIDNFDKMPQDINVGLGYDFSIDEYYQTIKKVVGYKNEFIYDLTKPVGMNQKLVDIQKLNQFGWKHKTSLEEGINLTYKYFLKEY